MFFFRLNKVKLIDNKTGKGFPFIHDDKALIQFWSLIVTENISLPNLKEYMDENDPVKKKAIAADLVKNVASSALMTPIQDIKDDKEITFGDTGILLHRSPVVPSDFTWQFTAIKLKDSTRHIGEEMQNVVNDPKFDSFAGDLPKVLGAAASPAFSAGVEIGKFIFNVLGKNMENKHDKQLGILETSFIKEIDYPDGKRTGVNVSDETGNMWIDYMILGT